MKGIRYFLLKIFKVIPRGIKKYIPLNIKTEIIYRLSSKNGKYGNVRDKRKAIVALAADYPNLGDVAITVAQAKFLADCLPEYEIIFFPCSDIYTDMKSLKSICTPDDLITIVGGGNMGDLYVSLESARRFVIKQFLHNRIVSFPQTIDFSNTPRGRSELKKSSRVYTHHGNLYLFAREQISFEMMKNYFPDIPVYMVPDIVLYLDKSQPVQQRQGILVCLRDDLELAFPQELRNTLTRRLKSLFAEVNVTDTLHPDNSRLPITEREKQLEHLLSLFRRSEVVITDRLHGLIFAVITGTPCVVLQSKNYKIKAIYETWLSTYNFIKFQNDYDIEQLLHAVEYLLNQKELSRIQPPNMRKYFEPLRKAVVGEI